ncbi:MAG: N-acetylmuramoyl-L-alanine amidase [Steroidobacteraceae bacterium]
MIKKVFPIGVVAFLSATVNLAWAAGAQLRGVHVAATQGATQVTLDLTAAAGEKLFTLEHPERAVIDLGHTRLAGSLRLPLGAGVVSGFRIGTQPGGTLRVVMQLKSSVPTHSVWMQGPGATGRELVITFGDASAAAWVDSAPRVIRAAHAPIESGRDVVVAVDAGHGGQDPGAIGHGGTREKDVVLAIARALAERINGEPGMRAVLTRDRDEFLVLRERIGRARIAKADMFVSIHADSIVNRNVSGASVYVLSEHGATNEAARWLADRENAADLMGGVKLDDKDKALASVLLDLSQTANISASMTAAQRVLGSIDAVGQVRKSQVQQAGFVVLKSPDIPSMLVETAYISNPAEELRLRNARHQAALADAIFNGLRGYFEANPPLGTRFAQARRSTVASVLAASADTTVPGTPTGRAP